MSIMKRTSVTAALICLLAVILAACGGGGGTTAETPGKGPAEASEQGTAGAATKTVSNEPVTLKVWIEVGMTDDEFNLYFTNPIKAKYPNITLEKVVPGKGNYIQDEIARSDQKEQF